jgi:hypothetical protein
VNNWVDGRQIPDLVVEADDVITKHVGGIVVRNGAALLLVGPHQGSLHVEGGASARLDGSQQGSVHVAAGARVVVAGSQQGSIHVERGGVVEVEANGRAQGSLHIDGLFINSGTRGGSTHVTGEIRDLPGSRVVQPVVRGGVNYYEW